VTEQTSDGIKDDMSVREAELQKRDLDLLREKIRGLKNDVVGAQAEIARSLSAQAQILAVQQNYGKAEHLLREAAATAPASVPGMREHFQAEASMMGVKREKQLGEQQARALREGNTHEQG
jgi:multidrug efflux pump subunit AcrA (membrane-fusion protein)